MNNNSKNKIKEKIIFDVLLILVSISLGFIALKNTNYYFGGFSIGIFVFSMFILLYNIRLFFNKDLREKEEIEENDERNIQLTLKAYSIAFKLTIFGEAITSVICSILNYKEISLMISRIIIFQLLVCCISKSVLSKKM